MKQNRDHDFERTLEEIRAVQAEHDRDREQPIPDFFEKWLESLTKKENEELSHWFLYNEKEWTRSSILMRL